MTLSDAQHEAEQRKAFLKEALMKAEVNPTRRMYLHDVEDIVQAIDALIQARIRESYHQERNPWNT